MNRTNITFASEEEKQSMRIYDLTFDFAKRIVDAYYVLKNSYNDDVT